MYNVNFEQLLFSLIPTFLRNVFFKAFVKIPVVILQSLYSDFYDFKNYSEKEVFRNSQIIYLEQILNEQFIDENPIYISDAINMPIIYVYEVNETNVVYLRELNELEELILRENAEYENEYHFVVNIPSTLMFNEIQLRNCVNKYKLAGRNYRLNIYQI